MTWQKIFFIAVLAVFLGVGLVGVFSEYKAYREEKSKYDNLEAQVLRLGEENEKIQSDIDYYSEPKNLEKELRSRFNYKSPGEKLLIVVDPE